MRPRAVLAMACGVLVAGTVWAQTPADSGFLANAITRLGLVFRGFGSLADGPPVGEIWRVALPAGTRHRVSAANDLAWPVPTPDGRSVYALRGQQVVRVTIEGGAETAIGTRAPWRKLVGVLPDGAILGFINGDPRPHPAVLSPNGTRTELPAPITTEDRERNAALLQDGRDFADNTRLELRASTRGGRGRDVFLITPDGAARNLSDCGEDLCGHPSRGADGLTVYYVRAPRG